jgi:hypothetical protein
MTMGYICPYCGEGLPEDETCPCQSFAEDEHGGPETRNVVNGPLTTELADIRSPVRQFLNAQFTAGLRGVQRRYREAAPALAVPSSAPSEANPGTVGTAADWLLRFLVHPAPHLDPAIAGAALCSAAGIKIPRAALDDLLNPLGLTVPLRPSETACAFTGPHVGTTVEPAMLNRVCWVLALLTEVFRGGPGVAALGPLGRFRGRAASTAELLDMASDAALRQLTQFRHVYEAALLPALSSRCGRWAIGPTFTGSELMNADADLIAAGLLLELKTTGKRPSLGVTDLFQVIGYTLLDFADEFSIDTVGIFNARYAHLTTWSLGPLLEELADRPISLGAARAQFRDLLVTCSTHASR